MRIARLLVEGRPRLAQWTDDVVHLHVDPEVDARSWLANPNPEAFSVAWNRPRKLLCPIADPEKIICIGKNYADHAAEMGGPPPALPVVFSKFASALCDPEAPVRLPAISREVDYEAELVIVIGKTALNVPTEHALEHIWGYTCGNDISARDWQKGKPGGQWLLGKSFDTFAPLGPWLVSRDEVPDPGSLDLSMRLNGEVMQASNTRHLLFSIEFLVAHLSQFFTLRPGDLIFTGTPAGVGAGRTPPRFLKSGDQLEVTIEGLGTLSNPVLASTERGGN